VLSGREAKGLKDLECLIIKDRIARGSGRKNVGNGAIGSDADKKGGGIKAVCCGGLRGR